MKRILLFTDSLALPRITPDITLYEDTYPYKLRRKYEVFQYSRGGTRIVDLCEQAHYYQQYNPDLVIIQCGIVDCAPRAFSWNEELFMQSNFIGRKLRAFLSLAISTKKIRDFRKKNWTDILTFERSCEKFKELFPGIPIYAVSIAPASDEYESKVPGVKLQIKRYNNLLKNIFGDGVISLSDIPFDYLMNDGHHLNSLGHQYVYDRIIESIE